MIRGHLYRACMVIGLVAALAACGTGSSHPPVNPKTLGLQRGDLPKRFALFRQSTRAITNAQAARSAGVSLATFRGKGRVVGYETQYQRSDVARAIVLPKGVVIVDSQVSSWKSSDGARWDFQRGVRRAPTKSGYRLSKVPGSPIGDEDAALSTERSFSGQLVALESVVFRRDQYLAVVTVAGRKGSVGIGDAARYARIIDRRIRAKG